MKFPSVLISVLTALAASFSSSATPGGAEAVVKIKVRNLDGRRLSYNRSYAGAYVPTFTGMVLDGDSTATLTLPAGGAVERMMVIAARPGDAKSNVNKSFYVLPGVTEVTIDPLAGQQVTVTAPTGIRADGLAAAAADSMYDIWFALATGGKDRYGIGEDSIPAVVTAKLLGCVDSIAGAYADASPVVLEAMKQDARMQALNIFMLRYGSSRRKGSPQQWQAELDRMRAASDLNAPVAALSSFLPDVVRSLFYADVDVDGMTADAYLQAQADYILDHLHGKPAEAALGTLIYADGERRNYSTAIPSLTERFKSLFPDSGLMPLLDKMLAENIAFNRPNDNAGIVFIDNTSIKTLDDLLAPYRGKPVLIDVWATWCGPCRKSFAHAGPIQQYAADNGVQLLYLSVDEQPDIEEQWMRMARGYNLTGHHVLINPDIKQQVYDTFGRNSVLSIPRYAIVDRDGNISLCDQYLAEQEDFAPLRVLLDKVK